MHPLQLLPLQRIPAASSPYAWRPRWVASALSVGTRAACREAPKANTGYRYEARSPTCTTTIQEATTAAQGACAELKVRRVTQRVKNHCKIAFSHLQMQFFSSHGPTMVGRARSGALPQPKEKKAYRQICTQSVPPRACYPRSALNWSCIRTPSRCSGWQTAACAVMVPVQVVAFVSTTLR